MTYVLTQVVRAIPGLYASFFALSQLHVNFCGVVWSNQ